MFSRFLSKSKEYNPSVLTLFVKRSKKTRSGSLYGSGQLVVSYFYTLVVRIFYLHLFFGLRFELFHLSFTQL